MSGALASRTALVTGASRGIGAGIARAFAEQGARVALVARSRDRITSLAAQIGGGALPLVCDISDETQVAATAAAIRTEFGESPDILVNNAGAFRLGRMDSIDRSLFTESLMTNLMGPFLMVRELLGEMRGRGRGHIVTIGSVADKFAFAENGPYAVSKFGLRAMHEVMLAELKGTGVRSTLISPSAVDTDLWDPIDTESGNAPFPKRASMLPVRVVAGAVMFAVTQPAGVNVDELRLTSG